MTNINSRVTCFLSLEHTLWEDLQVCSKCQIKGSKKWYVSE
jgi:hypothetical protein